MHAGFLTTFTPDKDLEVIVKISTHNYNQFLEFNIVAEPSSPTKTYHSTDWTCKN